MVSLLLPMSDLADEITDFDSSLMLTSKPHQMASASLKNRSRQKHQLQRQQHQLEDDVSSTQDESDLSSTFWKRVVPDDESSSAVVQDDAILRVVPFVSLDLRLDSAHSDGNGDDDDDDDSLNIQDILEKQKEQELFYGEIRQHQVASAESLVSIGELSGVDGEEDEDGTFCVSEVPSVLEPFMTISQATPRNQEIPKALPMTPPRKDPPPPRAPVPKMISFDSFESATCASSSQSADSASDDEHDDVYILDPVEPLIHGSIAHASLAKSAGELYELLQQHLLHDSVKVHQAAQAVIKAAPETCQVRYHPPGFGGCVYPLSYFCATGHLLNIQTAYNAFPEAIGQEDPWVGTPLHYACYHNAEAKVVEFLLNKFPEAVRVTNYAHRTPVHMVCMSDTISADILRSLLERYPTAAQLADEDGYTPFHLACLHGASTEILQLLMQMSPSVVRMSTRSLQKPLHVTCLHAPVLETVLLLLKKDPSSARSTDEYFSTALHCAVQGKAEADVLVVLIKAHPGAVFLTNDYDETPLDIAKRQGANIDMLNLLRARL